MVSDKKPRVLIPSGQGLNCEEETAFGYRKAGAEADIVHINDVIGNPGMLEDYQILALIGGFTDGDHIASGRIHANRLRHGLWTQLMEFIDKGKLVIGVCNGFQAMVKSGLLPSIGNRHEVGDMTLTYNDSGIFEDRWVDLAMEKNSKCIWTRGIENLSLPIRHGEGKMRLSHDGIMHELESSGQIAMRYVDPRTGKVALEQDYPHNPNGSVGGVAGICDPSGRVFGMMPHWEGFMYPYSHPLWTRLNAEGRLLEGLGMRIARNGVEYAMEKLM